MAKKFYWMKLKEDFFDDDAIEWLEEQPKGKEYALFYLKLCLKSLKTNGILIRTVGTMLVPYDHKKLAEITKTDYDTTVVALELLKNIGLIELLDEGAICIPRMAEMIGSETDKAALMRKSRERKKMVEGNVVTEELPSPLPDSYQNVTQRLEIRDKEIDIKNIVEPQPQQPPKKQSDRVGEFEYQCVEILIASCLAVFPNSKVPRAEKEKHKWAQEIERMKRLDNRSEEEIIEALTYATTDQFWKSNIRSTKKFREKCETLIIQNRKKNGIPANPSGAYKQRLAELAKEQSNNPIPENAPEVKY